MMIFLSILAGIFAWAILGTITAGLVVRLFKLNTDDEGEAFAATMAGIFFPLAIIGIVVGVIAVAGYRKLFEPLFDFVRGPVRR